MNNQISIDRKIIIKPIIITQIVNRCNVPTAAGRGSGRTTNFEGRCLNLRKTTTKHRSIKKLSSDLGFLHNSLEIFIFKRPKTKVLRHSKNATVLEIWLDQGIYTGEKIFSFWNSFTYNGIERVGMIIKMITGGSSGDLPEGKGSIEFFDEVLQHFFIPPCLFILVTFFIIP